MIMEERANEEAIRALLPVVSKEVKAKLLSYLKTKVKNKRNRFQIEYSVRENGKAYAIRSASLQNLPSCVRNYIAGEFYQDVDVRCCQPTLLLKLSEEHNIDFEDLKYYIQNRSEVHDREGITKHDFLAAMNDERPPTHLYLKSIHDKIYGEIVPKLIENHPDWWNERLQKKTYNVRGSFLAHHFLHRREAETLKIIVETLSEMKYKPEVLIHDGCLVSKEKLITDEVLKVLCEKTGMEVVVKPMASEYSNESLEDQYVNWKRVWELTHAIVWDPNHCAKDVLVYHYDSTTWLVNNPAPFKKMQEQVELHKEYNEEYFEKWRLDKQNRPAYSRVDFLPPPLTVPENTFNLWKDPRVFRKPDTVNEDVREKVIQNLELLFNHLGGAEEVPVIGDPNKKKIRGSDFLKQYTAHMLQFPGEKPGVSVFFRSFQGCGKGTYLKVVEALLGSRLAIHTSSQETITGKFNGQVEGTLLMFYDEVVTQKMLEGDGALKSMITETTMSIRKMHRDPYVITSFVRVMGATNAENPVRIPADDRRFVIFEPRTFDEGPEFYASDGSIKWSEEEKYYAWEYLANTHVGMRSMKQWQQNRPLTQAYLYTQQTFVPYEYRFLCDEILDKEGALPHVRMSRSKIYDMYKRYMEFNPNSTKLGTNQLFHKLLRDDFLREVRVKSKRMIEIDMEKLRTWLRNNTALDVPSIPKVD